MTLPSRFPTAGPGAGLETPGPLSFGLTPLTFGIEDTEPEAEGPSLVGGAPPAFSPLFFLPNRKDIFVIQVVRLLGGFAETIRQRQ